MDDTTTLHRLADDAWRRVCARDPETTTRLGGTVTSLPAGGSTQLAADVTTARHALTRLAEVDENPLSTGDRLLTWFLRDHLTQEVAEAERFWYRFPVTPYYSLRLSTCREQVFDAMALERAEDADRYLSLLDDYVAIVEELRTTLDEQRKRGITLPAWAVPAIVDTMHGHATADLVPSADRLAHLAPGPAGRLTDGVTRAVAGRLAAAFQSLLTDLTDLTTGPQATGVGIGQYPGGTDCYAGLVRLHTGLDLSPDRVHEIGLAEVDRLTERVRAELGIVDEAGYRRELMADPRLYATEPADVERIFQGHLDRLLPHLPDLVETVPAAPFHLRRLDPALEGGLTYGYYDPPGADGRGYYRYNGANLADRPLLDAASLIYHEGLPGHHLQLGRQAENTALHPIQRELTGLHTFALNGFHEGWAEYAAGLCGELGLYADPVDAYGRLCAERFQAARLVVDTGMNVLGWSRERAADYLRRNGFLTEREIASEVLRYAVDDPGQALGYHLGHWYLRQLRGNRELKEFHEAVLSAAPLPLALLGKHVAGSALDQ